MQLQVDYLLSVKEKSLQGLIVTMYAIAVSFFHRNRPRPWELLWYKYIIAIIIAAVMITL